MPRYYRKRYTRVVRPKKRWATNYFQSQSAVSLSVGGNAAEAVLAANSTQVSVPTPIIVKAGNFKLQLEFQFQSAGAGTINGASCNAYVMYVPEGTPEITDYTVAMNYIKAHPEYIMGMKTLDVGSAAGNTSVSSLSSRLKRNLNSGDRITLIITAKLAAGSTATVSGFVHVIGQYWTTTA